MSTTPAIPLEGEDAPTHDTRDWDNLLDKLHRLGICGCLDCGPCHMQGGHSNTGHWLAAVFPDGQRHEYIAPTRSLAAWKLTRALPEPDPLPH